MKNSINYFSTTLRGIILLCSIVLFTACSKEENENSSNPEAGDINAYIASLPYDPNSMLNVQETGGVSSLRTLNDEYIETSYPDQGTVFECDVFDYTLDSNFDDVAILRPTNGVIYPGALVVGNQEMLDGAPNPIGLRP